MVDAGRYGFVKLQCCIPAYGFEELNTYTDSNSLFEGLWDEWFNPDLFLIAMKLQLDNIVGDKVFNILPKGKQSELIGRKADFATVAGISL